jgi:hypothetical protein
MANLSDIGVARKMDSSEYQPYACGSIFRAPWSQPNLPISGWTLVGIEGHDDHDMALQESNGGAHLTQTV